MSFVRSIWILLLVFSVLLLTAGQCNGVTSNTPPTADAGSDQTVTVGDTVTLDGSASSDADGDPLSFSWELTVPVGSSASLDDAESSTPSFTADEVGSFEATLTVNDGTTSVDDSVIVTANAAANTPPALSSIADASTPRTDSIEIAFSITDEDPSTVTVVGTSNDQTLVADGDIEVLGSTAKRTLRVTPSPVGEGSVFITLMAEDAGGLKASESFTLEVTIPFETELPKLTASDGAADDSFGWSVAISGDYAIVGTIGDDDGGADSGSAYVFERSGSAWNEVAKLTASDGAADDWFGIRVAISGDYAIVGTIGDDDGGADSGSAYVFERSGSAWNEVAKLTASDGVAGDEFGVVAISGDYAIVGAHLDDDAGADSGSAYVFERSGSAWNEVAKLTASDDTADDDFGISVAISGDTVIVGARFDDDAGADSGSAYVFERSGNAWNEVAKLTASDGAADDWFGASVAISGDHVIVGAPTDDDGGADSGSAYVFERSGNAWNEVAKLTASDGAAGDIFGISVAISGDVAIVSSHLNDDAGADSGSAYVFERSGNAWNEVAKLTASDAAAGDGFGLSVSASGNDVIVGAPLNDNSGSAYLFQK